MLHAFLSQRWQIRGVQKAKSQSDYQSTLNRDRPSLITTHLPFFPGFYNSSLSDLMDTEEESAEPHTLAEYEIDYSTSSHNICKVWLQAFNDEMGTCFEYASLWSPREYNFVTDQLRVNVQPRPASKEARTTWALLNSTRRTQMFARVVEKELKPYDGFIPFYDNDVRAAEWQKHWSEWDAAQIALLIHAAVRLRLPDVHGVGDMAALLLRGRFDYKFTEAVKWKQKGAHG